MILVKKKINNPSLGFSAKKVGGCRTRTLFAIESRQGNHIATVSEITNHSTHKPITIFLRWNKNQTGIVGRYLEQRVNPKAILSSLEKFGARIRIEDA